MNFECQYKFIDCENVPFWCVMLGKGREGDVHYVCEGIYGNSLAGLGSDPKHPFPYLSADSPSHFISTAHF